MYLRRKQTLSIGEICQQWAKEPNADSDPLNILTLLLQEFWRGVLGDLHPPNGGERFLRRHGLEALVDFDSGDGHPDIVICRKQEQLDAEQILLASGDVVVDLRKHVLLPADIADWTEELCGQVYEKLAECEATSYAPDFLVAFKTMHVSKRSLLILLQHYELEPPCFWFDPDHPTEGQIRRATTTAVPSIGKHRGRPTVYDYPLIDDILEALLVEHGLAALRNFPYVKDQLILNLGKAAVPSDSQLRRHLKARLSSRTSGF